MPEATAFWVERPGIGVLRGEPRALVTDVSVFGVDVLSKFHAGAEQILWYYRTNLDLALRRQVTDILVRPLRLALDELDELITAATSVRQSEITPLA